MSTGVFLHGREVKPDDVLEWQPFSDRPRMAVVAGDIDTYHEFTVQGSHLEYIRMVPATAAYYWPKENLRAYVEVIARKNKRKKRNELQN